MTDEVGRKNKREADGLGRLVKVTEQDSSGTLNQESTYSYSLLDQLTQLDQGGQLRKFKYDALGRLLYELIPEHSATINDGTGVMWSCKYTYTTANDVATRQDARGVITSYSYDDLHRVIGISYNTSGATGVAATPGVTMVYDEDTNYGTSAPGQLMRVNVSDLEERYTYDGSNRVASKIQKVAISGGHRTYTTANEYNEASQLKRLTYPSGSTVNIVYDNKGRVSSMPFDPQMPWLGGYLKQASYNTTGQLSGVTLGNDVAESYGYDSQRLQLTSQTATKSGNTLLSLTYSYQAQSGDNGTGSTVGNSGQLMSISGSINGQTEWQATSMTW